MRISGEPIEEVKIPISPKTSVRRKPTKIFNNKPAKPTTQPSKKYDFKLGERQGNIRIIGVEGVSTLQSRRGINNIMNYYADAAVDSSSLQGDVGPSKQCKRRDCYLLAEINAIRNTEDGQAILDKNSSYNEATGIYTITLPGAIKVRQEYEKKGLGEKCEVTGVYKITKEAMEKANKLQGNSYSKGNLKVVAYEIAIENYRAELLQTQQNVGGKGGGRYTAEGSGARDPNDILAGGHTFDAGFLLTGQKSDIYIDDNKRKNPKQYYIDGSHGYITREQMESQAVISRSHLEISKGVSEVNHIYKNDSDLTKMLDNYAGREGKYAITVSVITGKDDDNGTTKRGGGHAMTVVKITADVVYVANPWHPDKIEPIPRDEFERMACGLTVQEMNLAKVNNTFISNGTNDLLHHNGSTGGKLNISSEARNRLHSTLLHVGQRTGHLQNNSINNQRLNNLVQHLGNINLNNLNNLSKKDFNGDEKQTLQKMFQYIQNDNVELKDADYEKIRALLNK